MSSWFCFSPLTACKSKYFRLQRKYFRLRFRGLLLVVVVLFVDQVCDQLVQSMRNSDPRVRIVFVYRFNSNFHSIFTLQITGCDFQHGSNIGVPSNPNFRVSWFFISWQSVLTTCHWFCNLWELVSVLLSWSTLRLQYKSSSLDLVVEAFPLVPCASAIDFLMQEFQSKVWVSLSISLLARKVDQIALPQQVSLFLFDKYCIPHTILRLLRRYWADWQKWLCEKVSIVSSSAQKCIDNYPPPLLLSIPRSTHSRPHGTISVLRFCHVEHHHCVLSWSRRSG